MTLQSREGAVNWLSFIKEKPVGFVDEKGKPKAGLGLSFRKQADKCTS